MKNAIIYSEEEITSIIRSCIREELQEFKTELPQPEKQPMYYTRQEVSKLLSVSLVTLNSWEKKKVLLPQRIGTRVLYLASDVEQTLQRSVA
jgi:hypothetical protein